jgi:diacylglycerol kinase family enzyme
VVDAAEHDEASLLRGSCGDSGARLIYRGRVRIALVVNPGAGGRPDAAHLAAAMAPAEVVPVALGEIESGLEAVAPDRVAVAGGDGSIAPVAAIAGRLGVPLAVIPVGTANDFARACGLPLNVDAAARLAAHGERTRALELGRLADGAPFVNVAGAGLATIAARRAQPLKPRLGPLAYVAGAIRASTAPSLSTRVKVDGAEVFAGRAWQVIVACTGAFGGGAGVHADPVDGELDLVVLHGSRLLQAIGLRRRAIAPTRRGKLVEVELPPGTEVNADGELRKGGLERVTARAGAFRLVVGDDSP